MSETKPEFVAINGSDVAAESAHIDHSELSRHIDYKALAQNLELDTLAQEIDYEVLAFAVLAIQLKIANKKEVTK